MSERDIERLAQEVDSTLPDEAQVVVLDGTRAEGAQIADFYDITTLPAAMIVMDDDQLYQLWTPQLPTADTIVYSIGQTGARLRGDQT